MTDIDKAVRELARDIGRTPEPTPPTPAGTQGEPYTMHHDGPVAVLYKGAYYGEPLRGGSSLVDALNEAYNRGADAAASTIATLTARAESAERERDTLKARLAVVEGADMWWDYHEPERYISDPDEIIDMAGFEGGETFRLMAAKKLPDEFYTVVRDPASTDDDPVLTYRQATPDEIEKWNADEKAERDRRRAEMDAENARRKAALSPAGGSDKATEVNPHGT